MLVAGEVDVGARFEFDEETQLMTILRGTTH